MRLTLHRWEQGGLGGLWDTPGRGAKPKWQEEDIKYLEAYLDPDQRPYNSAQLAVKLEHEQQVKLSADRIRRILQKRGNDGSALAAPNSDSKTQSNSASNKPTSKP